MEGLGFYQWTSAFASFKFFARLLLMKLMNQWYEWSEPRTNRSSPKNVSSSFSTEKTRGLWWNLKPTIFFGGFSGRWPGAATTSATLGPRPGRRWAEIASVSPGSELLSSLDVPKNEGINGEIGWLVYVSYDYLIGGLEPWNIMTFHIYIYMGMSSSQLTFIFQRGWHQPVIVCLLLWLWWWLWSLWLFWK